MCDITYKICILNCSYSEHHHWDHWCLHLHHQASIHQQDGPIPFYGHTSTIPPALSLSGPTNCFYCRWSHQSRYKMECKDRIHYVSQEQKWQSRFFVQIYNILLILAHSWTSTEVTSSTLPFDLILYLQDLSEGDTILLL